MKEYRYLGLDEIWDDGLNNLETEACDLCDKHPGIHEQKKVVVNLDAVLEKLTKEIGV